jgi:nucleoside triphosphate pyrophosphatase
MTKNPGSVSLILASASKARRQMLASAGIEFVVQPADIDEAAVREALDGPGATMPPADVALVLAEAKATAIAERNPGALVIGADQVLALGDEILSKPGSIAEAHRQLKRLRGRTHELHSGVCCVRGDKTLWRHAASASLTVREFSDRFLQDYLNQEGENVCQSVGAYQLEGRGAQLFSKIDGDYFTILGMPLLPLLNFLREDGTLGK